MQPFGSPRESGRVSDAYQWVDRYDDPLETGEWQERADTRRCPYLPLGALRRSAPVHALAPSAPTGQCGRVQYGAQPKAAGFIFHIAYESDWVDAQRTGTYVTSTRGADLHEVGFIHASFEHQVATVGEGLYGDVLEPLVVLVIDTERLNVPLVIENLEGGEEAFPHIYGPLPAQAVVGVRGVNITLEGRFSIAPVKDP